MDELISVLSKNKSHSDARRIKRKIIIGNTGDTPILLRNTIDIVFVDLLDWMMSSHPGKPSGTSREDLCLSFSEWIESIWEDRARCKAIVVCTERATFVPSWKSGIMAEEMLVDLQDLRPYMWDDNHLGGPQGYENWMDTTHGRRECMNTLMYDICQNFGEYKKMLVPRENGPLILSCDLPRGDVVLWKNEKEPFYVHDFDIPGITGETVISVNSYVKQMKNGAKGRPLGFEFLSSNSEWLINAIHLSHMYQVGPGTSDLERSLKRDKFWYHSFNEDRWFHADEWHASFADMKMPFYGQWCSFYFLYSLNKDHSLVGTLLGSLTLDDLWMKYYEWGKMGCHFDQRSDKVLQKAEYTLAYVDPRTSIVTCNLRAYKSFLSFISDSESSKRADGYQVPSPKTEDMEDSSFSERPKLFSQHMGTIVTEMQDHLPNITWKILLEDEIKRAKPFKGVSKIPKDIKNALTKTVRSLIQEKPGEWEKILRISDLRNFFVISSRHDGYTHEMLEETLKIFLNDHAIMESIGTFISVLKTVQIGPGTFFSKLGALFNTSNRRCKSVYEYIISHYLKYFSYEKCGGLFSDAWQHAFLELVYKTIGHEPFYIEKAWYHRGDVVWGWNRQDIDAVRPFSSETCMKTAAFYALLDSERTGLDKSYYSGYYAWDEVFSREETLPHNRKAIPHQRSPISGEFSLLGIQQSKDGYYRFAKYSTHETHTTAPFAELVMKKQQEMIDLGIPKDLWNAYLYRVIPPGGAQKPHFFFVARIFNCLREIGHGAPTDLRTVKGTFRIVDRVLEMISKKRRKTPFYAENWLRELVSRSWIFASYARNYEHFELDRVTDNILTSQPIEVLTQEGALGTLLDMFFSCLAQSVRKLGHHVGSVVCVCKVEKGSTLFLLPLKVGYKNSLRTDVVRFLDDIRKWDKASDINDEYLGTRNLEMTCLEFQTKATGDAFTFPSHIAGQISYFYSDIGAGIVCNTSLLEKIWDIQQATSPTIDLGITWSTLFVVADASKAKALCPLSTVFETTLGPHTTSEITRMAYTDEMLHYSIIKTTYEQCLLLDRMPLLASIRDPPFYFTVSIANEELRGPTYPVFFDDDEKCAPMPGMFIKRDAQNNALWFFNSRSWSSNKIRALFRLVLPSSVKPAISPIDVYQVFSSQT